MSVPNRRWASDITSIRVWDGQNGRLEIMNNCTNRMVLAWRFAPRITADDLDDVARQLPAWIDHYNQQAPHSTLAMQSPAEFYAAWFVKTKHTLSNIRWGRTEKMIREFSVDAMVTRIAKVYADAFLAKGPEFPTVGPTMRLCAVGDIGLSGRVGLSMSSPAGPDAIFAEVATVLQKADLTFGNLETPLTGEIARGQLFAAPVAGAAMLKKTGFKLIHLANNHVYDYGQADLVATLDAVRKADLIPLGVELQKDYHQALVRTDMNGLRIGWLGCGRTLESQSNSGPSFWEFDEQELFSAIERDRADVDLLIVSIHIGLMYMDYPRPEHKAMAERFLAAGANLILMHHAHVLRSVQVTSERSVCCYNLGNFVFDWEEGNVKIPMMLREQNEGAVFHFVLDRNGVAQASALPVWIDDKCIVRWAGGTRGVEILNRLIRISRDLEHDFNSAFKLQRAERHTSSIFKVMRFHITHGNWSYVLESMKKARLEHMGMMMRWLVGALKRFAK